jgi:predicted GNAT superfamily acetyltransferase
VNAEIRRLSELRDLEECVRIQKIVWGFEDIDLLPLRFFVVAARIGGHVFGAFEAGRMVGFLLAIPGLKPDGTAYLHSHMLGLLPEHRGTGVGRRLKLAQRDDALARGIGYIEWTFDPLELGNAQFNIERLGAVVRGYSPNQYGLSSNQFDFGLPSDRCIAHWRVGSKRVASILAGGAGEDRPPIEGRISIPAEISLLRRSDPERAREIQRRASLQFQDYVAHGLSAVGFERTDEAGVYLLGKWDSE